MGKKHFVSTHYLPAKRALGGNVSLRITYCSDRYNPQGEFAGVIMYHRKGKFKWQNKHNGCRERAFYVAILDTSKWPSDAFRGAYIFKERFGEDIRNNRASVGGFTVIDGTTRYRSALLNTKTNRSYANKWYADGSDQLSNGERWLVDFAVQEWKRHGPNHICEIPSSLDRSLLELESLWVPPGSWRDSAINFSFDKYTGILKADLQRCDGSYNESVTVSVTPNRSYKNIDGHFQFE